MNIQTKHFTRCIETLEQAYIEIQKHEEDSLLYQVFRSAIVKEFEIILEQTSKLLKKRISPFFASSRLVDELTFKDIFRYSTKHRLLTLEEVERWFQYRDNRNHTAHDYGEKFAEETLSLLPLFIKDAYHIKDLLEKENT